MNSREAIERAVSHIENRLLDAIEDVAEYDPALVVFAGAGLIARMAVDFAPCKGDARDMLNLAIEHEMNHKAMDYAPEFKEAIRRIDAGEPVNTTAAEIGLTPKELLDVIGGALQ